MNLNENIVQFVSNMSGAQLAEIEPAEGHNWQWTSASIKDNKHLDNGEWLGTLIWRAIKDRSALEPIAEAENKAPFPAESVEHGEIIAKQFGNMWSLTGDTKPVKDIIKNAASEAGLRYQFDTSLKSWNLLNCEILPEAIAAIVTIEPNKPIEQLQGNGLFAALYTDAKTPDARWDTLTACIWGDTKPHKDLFKQQGFSWNGCQWVAESQTATTLPEAIRALFDDNNTPPDDEPPAPEPETLDSEAHEAENKFDWGTWGNPSPTLSKSDLWYCYGSQKFKSWYDAEEQPRPSVTLKTDWGAFKVEWWEDGKIYGQLTETRNLYTIDYRVNTVLQWDTVRQMWQFGAYRSMRVGADGKLGSYATDAAQKRIAEVLEGPMREAASKHAEYGEQAKRIREVNLLKKAHAKLDEFIRVIGSRRVWLQRVNLERMANGRISDEDMRRLDNLWGDEWRLR